MPERQDFRFNRSGRFKFDNAAGGKTIILNRSASLYRIYNSRLNDFIVDNGGTDFELALGNTIDIYVAGEVKIKTSAMNVKVSGIYDELREDTDIRTGRLKIRAAQTPGTKRVVLALTGQTDNLHYRFFNSGDNPFRIWSGATGATQLAQLEKSQSLDLSVKDTLYWISSANPYEAIYEMIGRD
jgi:hypothetical protein